jgi:hypothetical protein
MHNAMLGVIGFKVFECHRWIEDRVLVNDIGRHYALSPAALRMLRILFNSPFFEFYLKFRRNTQEKNYNHINLLDLLKLLIHKVIHVL